MTAPSYVNCSAALLIEMPRAFSMSIQSETVLLRPALPWIAPASLMTRACRARASVSVDLPASGWLMTAKVRRRAASSRAPVVTASRLPVMGCPGSVAGAVVLASMHADHRAGRRRAADLALARAGPAAAGRTRRRGVPLGASCRRVDHAPFCGRDLRSGLGVAGAGSDSGDDDRLAAVPCLDDARPAC